MCDRVATTLTGDLGIVFNDPNLQLAHPITQTHSCLGAVHHTKVGNLTIHHCECGASFYILAEALNEFVIMSPSLDELVKKAIRDAQAQG